MNLCFRHLRIVSPLAKYVLMEMSERDCPKSVWVLASSFLFEEIPLAGDWIYASNRIMKYWPSWFHLSDVKVVFRQASSKAVGTERFRWISSSPSLEWQSLVAGNLHRCSWPTPILDQSTRWVKTSFAEYLWPWYDFVTGNHLGTDATFSARGGYFEAVNDR